MKRKKLFKKLKQFYLKFSQDEIFALSAQVTYYLILAVFPFLIFLITLVSYTRIANVEYVSVVSRLVPQSIYQLIVDVLHDVMSTRDKTFLSFGMLAALWSASNGILAFMHGINKAYEIDETRPFWKVRLISVLFTLGLSMVLIFSIILLVFGEILGRQIFVNLGLSYAFMSIWNIIRYAVTLSTMLLVFMLLYFYSPNCKVYFKHILPGSFISTAGWIVTSTLFALYVNNFGNFTHTYGSLGAIIALLLWLYWSSIIILAGNEVNAFLYLKRRET